MTFTHIKLEKCQQSQVRERRCLVDNILIRIWEVPDRIVPATPTTSTEDSRRDPQSPRDISAS